MAGTYVGWAHRLAVFVLLLLCALASTGAQKPSHKATVTTTKGETIEGTLKSATETEVFLQVAGQTLRLPIDSIRTISFVGRLEEPSPSPRTRLIDDAFKAFTELEAATEIGVLRHQYSAKLLETLPRVQAFIKSTGESWADVRLLMSRAIEHYQEPLRGSSVSERASSWEGAHLSWGAARADVEHARELASQDGEESHREEPTERAIALGAVTGRLGVGDRTSARETDGQRENPFIDLYRLNVDRPVSLILDLVPTGFAAQLTLTDESGRQIAEGSGYQLSRITVSLGPGAYLVWAGAKKTGEVGRYVLTVTAK
jgi:hypothetical protein